MKFSFQLSFNIIDEYVISKVKAQLNKCLPKNMLESFSQILMQGSKLFNGHLTWKFKMQLSDSTEGLHGRFGHIPISSGSTAVLVFCGFVFGSVIINV